MLSLHDVRKNQDASRLEYARSLLQCLMAVHAGMQEGVLGSHHVTAVVREAFETQTRVPTATRDRLVQGPMIR